MTALCREDFPAEVFGHDYVRRLDSQTAAGKREAGESNKVAPQVISCPWVQGQVFYYVGNIAVRYFRNNDKSTLRGVAHA